MFSWNNDSDKVEVITYKTFGNNMIRVTVGGRHLYLTATEAKHVVTGINEILKEYK